jgi:hypothetical protein
MVLLSYMQVVKNMERYNSVFAIGIVQCGSTSGNATFRCDESVDSDSPPRQLCIILKVLPLQCRLLQIFQTSSLINIGRAHVHAKVG